MTDIILLRHGRTELSEYNAYCGSSDPPLSTRGIAETRHTAKTIRSFAPDCVYASDKRCTVQTARIAASRKSALFMTALREMDFGEFEGLNAVEIARLMPRQWQDYLNHPLAFVFPGGDTVTSFLAQAAQTVAQLAKRHEGQRILIVTHKGVIMAALSHFLHGDFDHLFHYDIRPSGFARLSITDSFGVLKQLY